MSMNSSMNSSARQVSTDNMEGSIRSWGLSTLRSLGRSRHSIHSVGGDSGIDSDYTHVSSGSNGGTVYPSLWIKIKYPIEADDAARSGMLTSCDFDEILERLQEAFPTWEIHFDAKRMTHYTRHSYPRTLTTDAPQHRIIVKIKFKAWRISLDVKVIKQIVGEVMNKAGEFYIELQSQKIGD